MQDSSIFSRKGTVEPPNCTTNATKTWKVKKDDIKSLDLYYSNTWKSYNKYFCLFLFKLRDLVQYEIDITLFPRTCAVCQSDKSESLKNCKHCFGIAFCQNHFDEGKAKHEEFCDQLRIAAEDYKNEKTLGHQVDIHI